MIDEIEVGSQYSTPSGQLRTVLEINGSKVTYASTGSSFNERTWKNSRTTSEISRFKNAVDKFVLKLDDEILKKVKMDNNL